MLKDLALPELQVGNLSLPAMALGTYGLDEEDAFALFSSYPYHFMAIDTAARYGNEQAIGCALRRAMWPRDRIKIIGKLARSDQERMTVKDAALASLARLDMQSFDVYLIHSPRCKKRVETWKQMLELKEEGLAACVGVSNFGVHELKELHAATNMWPEINQVTPSPFEHDVWWDVVDFCQENEVLIQVAMPFGGAICATRWNDAEISRSRYLGELFERKLMAIPGTKDPRHMLLNLEAYRGLTT